VIYLYPSSGVFKLGITSLNTPIVFVSILDASGKVIEHMTFQASSSGIDIPVDISNVKPGIYFIRVEAGFTVTERIVIAN